jgi:hypothetical protein
MVRGVQKFVLGMFFEFTTGKYSSSKKREKDSYRISCKFYLTHV